MYRLEPGARTDVASAPGYAVFDAVTRQFFIGTTSNAYGVVHDNDTGRKTYMRALSAGGGYGLGMKSMRAVVIFRDRQVIR